MTTMQTARPTDHADAAVGRYVCAVPTAEDDAAIRGLLNHPMPGRVSLALAHGPDHRAALRIAGDRVAQVVVRDQAQGGAVVGYGCRAVRALYLNGEPVDVGYLGGLRCDVPLHAVLRASGQSFEALAATRRAGEKPYDLTSIMADNTVARRALEKGLPGLPKYVPIGEMLTLTIKTGRAKRGVGARTARVASAADAVAIKRLLDEAGRRYNGRPSWPVPLSRCASGCDADRAMPGVDDFVVCEQAGKLTGCLAVWDQRAAKRVVVAGLSPTLRRLRYAINLAAYATGRPCLPAPGTALSMAYAGCAGFDLEEESTAVALFNKARALAAARGIGLLSIGLPADAPIARSLSKRLRAITSRSAIYAVTHDPDAIDLDDRPLWMEVATL